VKEVTAEIMSVGAGFSTNADSSIRINGSDWNHNMDQLSREEEKRREVFGTEEQAALKNTIQETIRDSMREMMQESMQEEKRWKQE